MLHPKQDYPKPSQEAFVESVETTVQKHSRTVIPLASSIHRFDPADLEAFANQSTPKRTHQPRQPQRSVARSTKSYTMEWSLVNMFIVALCVLMLIVVFWDYSAKKARLLAGIKYQIRECESSFHRNKCDHHGTHLKFQQVYQKCFQLRQCKHLDPEEELSRRLSVASIIGQIIRDFFNGLGFIYLVGLIGLIFGVGYLVKGKERITYQIKSN